jgi:hypothetical protein
MKFSARNYFLINFGFFSFFLPFINLEMTWKNEKVILVN